MLITFSGLDGAGKSTLIASLVTALEHERVRVAVCHMNRGVGVYAALRAVRDRVRSPGRKGSSSGNGATVRTRVPDEPANDPHRGDQPVRTAFQRLRHAVVWNKGLRRALYPLDLVVFSCYRFFVERSGRVLIMDRYFYDTLVDVADHRRWRLLRLYERATPVPTLPIFLDVGPEECFARKGEYSVEYLQRRWRAYHEVLPRIPTAVHLAATDLDLAKQQLHELVTHRLAAIPARS